MKYTSEATKLGTSDTLDLVVYEVKSILHKRMRVWPFQKELSVCWLTICRNRGIGRVCSKDNADNYRFSFIEISLDMSDDKSSVSHNYSNPRRYSYLWAKIHCLLHPNKYLKREGRVVDDEDLHSRSRWKFLPKSSIAN